MLVLLSFLLFLFAGRRGEDTVVVVVVVLSCGDTIGLRVCF